MINSQKQGGQFGPDTRVNLLRNQGGQLRPKKWGQFARNFQLRIRKALFTNFISLTSIIHSG